MGIDHLGAEGPEQHLRQACVELYGRLRSGEDCRAEQFFSRFPDLASNVDLALNLICNEFLIRQELGQRPAPEECYRRFPQWRQQLEEQFKLSGLTDEAPNTNATTVRERGGAHGANGHSNFAVLPVWFGPYEVLEEIGCGGMGVVYKARDSILNRLVALKRVRGGVLAQAAVGRFQQEARAAAQLKHPHIVPLYEFGQHAGEQYLTMALVTGGSLARHWDRYAADPRAAVTLLQKVARGVQAAHAQGIVHRDLKPSNILLDEQGEPLVSDFGLAKFIDLSAELTLSGQIIGTPAYMAPEQAAGRGKDVTPQTDVWALGVILYEVLTGQRPFPGKTVQEVTPRILNDEPPAPRRLRPALDRDLETIVLRCLEKGPQDRYASAGPLADELGRWLRNEPIVTRRRRWRDKVGRALRSQGRRRWSALLPCAAVVLLASGFLMSQSPPPYRSAPANDIPDPDAALQPLYRQLEAGQPVTLVGEKGLPSWYRWRTEQHRPPLRVFPREPFTFESWTTCLLELLPDPRCQRFRFSADVKQTSTLNGSVGLFFGADELRTADGRPEHHYITFTFSEAGDRAGHMRMEFVSYREADDSHGMKLDAFTVFDEKYEQGALSHHLSVEVTPEEIRLSWDEGPVRKRPPPNQTPFLPVYWANVHREASPPPLPAFAPRSHLGLHVYRSTAWFHNVIVSPL
jgi:serine/threonine protein kinase